jgi:hypothetical protein
MQFVAPYTGATVAEYFMYQGKATATIYDDLTKHAQGYREMCLLLRRTPAQSAVLIGASGDFRVGREQRPAINIGISVSRVGQKLQFDELQAFAQFASDLDAATQKQLARGQRLRELLKQPPALPYTTLQQVMLIFTGTRTAIIDSIPLESVAELKSTILIDGQAIFSWARGELGSFPTQTDRPDRPAFQADRHADRHEFAMLEADRPDRPAFQADRQTGQTSISGGQTRRQTFSTQTDTNLLARRAISID